MRDTLSRSRARRFARALVGVRRAALLAGILWVLAWEVSCTPAPQRLAITAPEGNGPAAIGLPAPRPGDQIVEHFAITLSYDESHEVAAWVAHTLSRDLLRNRGSGVERTDDFRADPAVATGSASPADYRGSGFDRGHLAPAADFSWSVQAMSESFYMSNIAPQSPALNRGVWKRLETAVRREAERDGVLHVVSGPIFRGGAKRIGPNRVAVPHAFFKVLLDPVEPEVKAIGFMVPHAGYRGSPFDFAVTVDEVERQTGIDFFAALPDEVEELLESRVDVELWGR